MIEPLGCESETGMEVVLFKVWKIFEDLGFARSPREHFENISNTDSQVSDAGPAATDLRIEGDACVWIGLC